MTDTPKILLNDFRAQWQAIRSEALQAIDDVGQSGWLILGREVMRFEEKLAELSKVRHVVGCANGLDAIEICLRALGLRPGEKVITTPLSAFATTLAILRAGGTPVFVDVDETGLIDLDRVEEFLRTSENPPRFLLPVHLFGHAISLRRLREIKETFHLLVVEDCAQAIEATSDRRLVGSVGDMSAISMYPTKNLGALGDAGAVLTNDLYLASMARALRDYGQSEKYQHAYLGLNSRLDELQAGVLSRSLMPRLPQATLRRQEIAQFYRAKVACPHLQIPPAPPGSHSVYHLFPTIVEAHRAGFQQHMTGLGIETAIHYPVLIPDQPALAERPRDCFGSLSMSRCFAEREVSLPIHPYLTDEHLERVCAACNSWSGR